MGRKGLDEDVILQEAVSLIAAEGIRNFSLRGLARRLRVRSASLYNHFDSLDDLFVRVARYVTEDMNRALYAAIEGRARTAAVAALFYAYRRYVAEHPEVYRVVLSLPQTPSAAVDRAAASVTGPVERVLADYDLSAEQRVHGERYLRSLMHGFATLESQGYLSHWDPPPEESCQFLADCAAGELARMEEEGRGHA